MPLVVPCRPTAIEPLPGTYPARPPPIRWVRRGNPLYIRYRAPLGEQCYPEKLESNERLAASRQSLRGDSLPLVGYIGRL